MLSFVLPLIASAFGEFPDVPYGYWAKNEIDTMTSMGFLKGAPDGNFYPESSVTRAEFAVIIVNSLKLKLNPGNKGTFTDVPKKHWAYNYIETASKAGFITGSRGKFRPNDNITRQEMAAIVMRISEKYGYPGEGSTDFLGKYKDNDQVAGWAAPVVSDAARFGYIQEVSYAVYESAYESHRYNRLLAPTNNATRAQSVFALYKLLVKTGQI